VNFIGVKRFSQEFVGQGLQGDRGGHLLSGSTHIFSILQRLRYRSDRVVQGDADLTQGAVPQRGGSRFVIF
jgi:hypothetical protein